MDSPLTPYAVLISGGQGAVAKLFVHGSTGKVGAVGQWDAICFDESTDKIFKEKDAVPLMKDYMESGSFSGAGGEITGVASIILNGNINQPVETVLQTSHLCHKAEDWFGYAYNAHQSFQPEIRDEAGAWALQLLTDADRLLEDHPTLNLERWINFARSHSNNLEVQDKYELDARRIVTVWGAPKIKSGGKRLCSPYVGWFTSRLLPR